VRRTTLRPRSRWNVLLALALALACAKPPPPPPPPAPPPPDPDGTPAQAQPLALHETHADSLDRKHGDLDDWYRVEVPKAGTLHVSVQGVGPDGLPDLFAAITDPRGVARVQPTRSGGRPRFELKSEVEAGTWLIWVGSEPESSVIVPYELRPEFQARPVPAALPECPTDSHRVGKRCVANAVPPAPPPPPRITTTSVVEVEHGQNDAQFATIAAGERAGVRAGAHGRLIDGGRTIGTFEVVEVYPAGSRVRIQGRLASPITARTSVEVEVHDRGAAP